MKKILALVLALAMVFGLAGCSINPTSTTYPGTEIKKFSVYCNNNNIAMYVMPDHDYGSGYFQTQIGYNTKEPTEIKVIIEQYCEEVVCIGSWTQGDWNNENSTDHIYECENDHFKLKVQCSIMKDNLYNIYVTPTKK